MHWLKINKKGVFIPEFINNLPDIFTLEFDLICNENFSFYSPSFSIMLLSRGASNETFKYNFIRSGNRNGVIVNLHPQNSASDGGIVRFETYQNGAKVIGNEVNTKQFNSENGNSRIKVSIWRQKQRIRMYINEDKGFDLPRGLAIGKEYDLAMFELPGYMSLGSGQYLFANLKLAVGAPVNRDKLISEGKFVTTGILFDVNSDKIRPESFGVLKAIASVLKENEALKVKIIGHTDSDGDDQANIQLSKKRAAAVSTTHVKDFGISENRMETDGMGEKQPLNNNSTSEAKANNRRVEFIKI